MQTNVYVFYVDIFKIKYYNIEKELMMNCVLEDKICINCGECDKCDLDPNKICDSCGKCLESESEYRAIKITEIKTE